MKRWCARRRATSACPRAWARSWSGAGASLRPGPKRRACWRRLPVPLARGDQLLDPAGPPGGRSRRRAVQDQWPRPRAWASTSRGPSPIVPCWRRWARRPNGRLFVAGSASDVPGAKGVGHAGLLAQSHRASATRRCQARLSRADARPRWPICFSRVRPGMVPPQTGERAWRKPRQFRPEEHRFGPTHWFEDLKVGQKFCINSRTQTEAMFAAFQLASGDNHPIHYDREYCRGARPSRPAGAWPAGGDPGRGRRRHLSPCHRRSR